MPETIEERSFVVREYFAFDDNSATPSPETPRASLPNGGVMCVSRMSNSSSGVSDTSYYSISPISKSNPRPPRLCYSNEFEPFINTDSPSSLEKMLEDELDDTVYEGEVPERLETRLLSEDSSLDLDEADLGFCDTTTHVKKELMVKRRVDTEKEEPAQKKQKIEMEKVSPRSDSLCHILQDKTPLTIPDENKFTVDGIEWNFSVRSKEFLLDGDMMKEIYVLMKRRDEAETPLWNDIRCEFQNDQVFRSRLIRMLLAKRDVLHMSMTTIHLAVRIFDRYLHGHLVYTSRMESVLTVCVAIASKLEEYDAPLLTSLHKILYGRRPSSSSELRMLEQRVYYDLNYKVDMVAAFIFANHMHTVLQSTKQQVHLANYLLELSLLDASFSSASQSLLGHAAVTLAHAIAVSDKQTATRVGSSDVESLALAERVLSEKCSIPAGSSRALGHRLVNLYKKASRDEHSLYVRYSREDELCVALFDISGPLSRGALPQVTSHSSI